MEKATFWGPTFNAGYSTSAQGANSCFICVMALKNGRVHVLGCVRLTPSHWPVASRHIKVLVANLAVPWILENQFPLVLEMMVVYSAGLRQVGDENTQQLLEIMAVC